MSFEGPRRGRPLQPSLVVEILQQLRVDFAAGHRFAQRRVLEVGRGAAGHADQNQLVAQELRVDFALEHVERRNVAPRVAFEVVDPTAPSSSVGTVTLPIDSACTEGPSTWRRNAGAFNATRSISTDSAGVSVLSMSVTSGMRRMMPLCRSGDRHQAMTGGGLLEFIDAGEGALEVADIELPRRGVRAPRRIRHQHRRSAQRLAGRIGRLRSIPARRDRRRSQRRAPYRWTARLPAVLRGSDRAAARAQAVAAATVGPLPTSGCRRRWLVAATSSMSRTNSASWVRGHGH